MFILYGIFLAQGSNLVLLWLLYWQVDSLPLSHLGILKNNTCLPQHLKDNYAALFPGISPGRLGRNCGLQSEMEIPEDSCKQRDQNSKISSSTCFASFRQAKIWSWEPKDQTGGDLKKATKLITWEELVKVLLTSVCVLSVTPHCLWYL